MNKYGILKKSLVFFGKVIQYRKKYILVSGENLVKCDIFGNIYGAFEEGYRPGNDYLQNVAFGPHSVADPQKIFSIRKKRKGGPLGGDRLVPVQVRRSASSLEYPRPILAMVSIRLIHMSPPLQFKHVPCTSWYRYQQESTTEWHIRVAFFKKICEGERVCMKMFESRDLT